MIKRINSLLALSFFTILNCANMHGMNTTNANLAKKSALALAALGAHTALREKAIKKGQGEVEKGQGKVPSVGSWQHEKNSDVYKISELMDADPTPIG